MECEELKGLKEKRKKKEKRSFKKVEEENDKTTWKREGEEVAEGES